MSESLNVLDPHADQSRAKRLWIDTKHATRRLGCAVLSHHFRPGDEWCKRCWTHRSNV